MNPCGQPVSEDHARTGGRRSAVADKVSGHSEDAMFDTLSRRRFNQLIYS
jgi:hypothetical protein